MSNLAQYMGDLQEDLIFSEVNKQLAEGIAAEEVFAQLQAGMGIVGLKYQANEYYLSELVMAAEMFKNAAAILQDKLQKAEAEKIGTMVLGTVAGDIHDIGKDIVAMIFTSNGFKVVDLGVDVPIQNFVNAVKEHRPELVGISCLLTTSFENMKATIAALEKENLRDKVKVLIGGGPVDQATCDYVKADAVCNDAAKGVAIAKKILGVE